MSESPSASTHQPNSPVTSPLPPPAPSDEKQAIPLPSSSSNTNLCIFEPSASPPLMDGSALLLSLDDLTEKNVSRPEPPPSPANRTIRPPDIQTHAESGEFFRDEVSTSPESSSAQSSTEQFKTSDAIGHSSSPSISPFLDTTQIQSESLIDQTPSSDILIGNENSARRDERFFWDVIETERVLASSLQSSPRSSAPHVPPSVKHRLAFEILQSKRARQLRNDAHGIKEEPATACSPLTDNGETDDFRIPLNAFDVLAKANERLRVLKMRREARDREKQLLDSLEAQMTNASYTAPSRIFRPPPIATQGPSTSTQASPTTTAASSPVHLSTPKQRTLNEMHERVRAELAKPRSPTAGRGDTLRYEIPKKEVLSSLSMVKLGIKSGLPQKSNKAGSGTVTPVVSINPLKQPASAAKNLLAAKLAENAEARKKAQGML